VRKTTGEVAAIGVAIRNHLEAGMFSDMTRDDIDAVWQATTNSPLRVSPNSRVLIVHFIS
jgi:hypothetical protein